MSSASPTFLGRGSPEYGNRPKLSLTVTVHPLPLIKKLLDAGADPNALVDNTPRARMREGSPESFSLRP